MALSCHKAMDLFFCQEMRDALWVSSESLGSLLTVITVPMKFSCGTVTARKPSSHRGRAVTTKEGDVVREMKGEGTPSASLKRVQLACQFVPIFDTVETW